MTDNKLTAEALPVVIAASTLKSFGAEFGAIGVGKALVEAGLKVLGDSLDEHEAWKFLRDAANKATEEARKRAHSGPKGVS